MSRVAVIAGDGIGQEVIPAGIDVVKKAAAACGAHGGVHRVPVGLRLLPEDRPHDARGRVRSAPGVRRHLSRRDRRSVGARPHRGVAAHPADPPAVRSVRQPAADAAGRRASRRRSANRKPADIDMVCVRENSEGEYGGIGGRVHVGPAERGRAAAQRVHAARHRADRALRVRDGDEASAEAARQRDEVERAELLDGAVGRGRRRRREGLPVGVVAQVPRGRARGADGDRSRRAST